MASRRAGALYIDFRANTAKLKKGTTKALAHVKKFKRGAIKELKKVSSAVNKLKMGFGILTAGVLQIPVLFQVNILRFSYLLQSTFIKDCYTISH